MREVVQLSLNLISFVDLNLRFVHLGWEILRVFQTFGFPLFDYSIIFGLVPVEKIEHVIEFGWCDFRPNDDFFPVSEATTVMEWRNGESIVHVLQLLLSGQCILDEVGVKAAQTEDENAEH